MFNYGPQSTGDSWPSLIAGITGEEWMSIAGVIEKGLQQFFLRIVEGLALSPDIIVLGGQIWRCSDWSSTPSIPDNIYNTLEDAAIEMDAFLDRLRLTHVWLAKLHTTVAVAPFLISPQLCQIAGDIDPLDKIVRPIDPNVSQDLSAGFALARLAATHQVRFQSVVRKFTDIQLMDTLQSIVNEMSEHMSAAQATLTQAVCKPPNAAAMNTGAAVVAIDIVTKIKEIFESSKVGEMTDAAEKLVAVKGPLLALARGANAKALLNAVTHYDSVYIIASLSAAGTAGGLDVLMKGMDGWQEGLDALSNGRKVLAICNLLQAMFNQGTDRNTKVAAALSKAPKSGPFGLHAELIKMATEML